MQLFSHLEGIVVAPTIIILSKRGIIDIIINKRSVSLNDLSSKENVQMGYLNVALGTLASLGILKKKITPKDILFDLTHYGEEFLNSIESYEFYNKINVCLNNFITNDIEAKDVQTFLELIDNNIEQQLSTLKKLHSTNSLLQTRIAHHIEGFMLYPLILWISHNQECDNLIDESKIIIKKIISQNSTINNQEIYDYLMSKSKSYGVTASYQPIFSNLDKIIFSNKNLIYDRKIDDKEIHVNRRLNVWGSGGAHKTYFKKIDKIVIDIFNGPIESQPLGIADMGCGDGMFLKHLYHIIVNNTIRGEHLNEHPLALFGADLNQEALDVANRNLTSSNIDCDFLIADISNPKKYKEDLESKFNIDIKELFHVRSFLDHNRIYKNCTMKNKIRFKTMCSYSYKGRYISSEEIISNLIDHFSQWKKYINKHGLLLLELHGVAPDLSASNKCLTPTIAYEATHGYSDQFIVEYEIFLQCAQFAELNRIKKHSKIFPNERFTTISLNIFK